MGASTDAALCSKVSFRWQEEKLEDLLILVNKSFCFQKKS
jgi:hypothetical protein